MMMNRGRLKTGENPGNNNPFPALHILKEHIRQISIPRQFLVFTVTGPFQDKI